MQNCFNFASNLTPYFDELSGTINRGVEIDTAEIDYIYGFETAERPLKIIQYARYSLDAFSAAG